MNHKRLFGRIEVWFDAFYLCAAAAIGLFLLVRNANSTDLTAGCMALILAGGDAFHLIPRMQSIRAPSRNLTQSLGRGKQITSITMTVFYLLLWQIACITALIPAQKLLTGLLGGLAMLRVFLCLLPQNRWDQPEQPLVWSIARNLPFFLIGGIVAAIFALYVGPSGSFPHMWIAIAISFCCYAPVVVLSNRYPAVGMLMLPKTCAYLWMLLMVLFP